jgi:hypothetical protein
MLLGLPPALFPIGPEVALTYRERCEFLVAAEGEAHFVGHVHQAPTIVDHGGPMPGITQRDRDFGERRVLG